jgi:hypothetical protein
MAGGNCQVIVAGQSLPSFDVHCPLLSLPRVFGTTFLNIPHTVPYVRADSLEINRWRRRITTNSTVLTVGLVWAGMPGHKNDRNRSMQLESFASLGPLPGIRFYSLQKGDAAAESRTPPAGMELVDWTKELTDFADTAALIANLDLTITIDSAVAHLAGALGKPVWTLLPFAPDWRWLTEREDSPWYPTMRLFRQTRPGDWAGVMLRVAAALAAFGEERQHRASII